MLARQRAQLRRQELLAQRAAEMREQATRSEAALWEALRARRLGVEVRRQVVLGDAIVDFLVPAARLAIEVDGACHRARATADASRDRKLARLGYRVLRLDAELVLRAPQVAVALIREALPR